MDRLRNYRMLAPQFRFMSSITRAQRDAILAYTGDMYLELNRSMRNDIALDAAHSRLLSTLDGIFDAVPPIEETMTVYRGIRNEFSPDRISTMSTTYSMEQALSFADHDNPTVLRIQLAPGSKVLPVELCSSAGSCEKEVLVSRKGKLFVTQSSETGGVKLIDVSYMPDASERWEPRLTPLSAVSWKVSTAEWANRLRPFVTRDELELYDGDVRALLEDMISASFPNERIPEESIQVLVREFS